MQKEIRKILKIGDSLYMGIPAKSNRNSLGLSTGDYVSIEFLNNKMIVESVNPSGKIDLQTHHTQPTKEGGANDGIYARV